MIFSLYTSLYNGNQIRTSLPTHQHSLPYPKHVNELEKQFGIQLFERKGNRIVLTKSWQMILKYLDARRNQQYFLCS